LLQDEYGKMGGFVMKAKKLIFVLIVVVFTLLLSMLPLEASAADLDVTITSSNTVAQNQAAIQSALTAAGPGGAVTVYGEVSGVAAQMTLNIPAGVTVKWEADYSSLLSLSAHMISLSGDGLFVMEAGWIEHRGSGGALYSTGVNMEIIVCGGCVAANTGSAIQMTGLNAAVTVCGYSQVYNKSIGNIQQAIQMSNQNNNRLNVTVKGNACVSSQLEGDSYTGYAIQTYGDVDISENAQVYALGGRAINALGANSTINVSGDSKIWTKDGIVIRTSGANATVIVSGGEVFHEADRSDHPVIYMEAGQDLTVSGDGKVLAKGNGRVVETSGNVTVEDNGVMSAASGNVIHASGANSVISVYGGEVLAAGGNAIHATGATAAVNISGGAVAATSGNAVNVTGANAVINISGGTVAATTGNAVSITGASSAVNIHISGGQVSAATGYAVNANSASSTVNISGGFVFAYGANIGAVVRNPAFFGPSGNGIATAWNKPANPLYAEGSSTNLTVQPATATVTWTGGGLSYVNGANSSFFPISEVTVTSDFGLIFNVGDGYFYFNLDGTGSLITNNLRYNKQNNNYSWDGGMLTLYGFSWNTDVTSLIQDEPVALWISGGDLTINLAGGSVNAFVSICGNSDTIGILTEQNRSLTIEGEGILRGAGSATAAASTGISCGGDLIVNGGTLLASGGAAVSSVGIYCAGDMIVNGGLVEASGGAADNSVGIYCAGDMAVNGGLVEANGGAAADSSVGIFGGGRLSINGGELLAAGAGADISIGIDCGQLGINSGVVTAMGHTFALSTEPDNADEAYIYWTNTAYSAPADAGTLYYSGSGNAAYSYSAADRYVKIAANPVAVISDIVVSGTVGTPLPPGITAAITIYGDTAADGESPLANAAAWFDSGLPNGLTVAADRLGVSSIQLTFGSTPRSGSAAEFGIIIPGSALTGGADVPVQPNPRALFDITYAIYTVTFDPNGGTVSPTSGQTDTDGKLSTLPTPAREGYTFNGWFTAPGGGVAISTATEFSSDETIYAQWGLIIIEPTIYTVTFDPNGGTVSPTSGQTSPDGKLPTLPTPAREGYTFNGWFTAPGGGVAITTATEFSSDETIYAQWGQIIIEPTIYTVTFDPNGGAVYPTSGQTDTDGKLSTMPTPTREGYTFSGWFTAPSGGVAISTATEFLSDATIYAQWEQIYSSGGGSSSVAEYTVAFNTNGGPAIASQKIRSGGKAAKPADPSKEGYIFAGWYADKGLTAEFNFSESIAKNTTIYAKWAPIAGDSAMAKQELVDVQIPLEEHEHFFEDVLRTDWFFANVYYANANSLMTGTSTDPPLFSPHMPVTRGMIVTVLHRMAGSPDAAGFASPFKDVAADKYYTSAVKWAAHHDIVLGYGNGAYGPENHVTREQLAAILYRYEQFSGKIPPDILMDEEFADWHKISAYAKNPVNVLQIQCVITGKPGNLFDPQGKATRAELAAILHRFCLAAE
jgi:uncharacterized repeat protein (TIGR02543 family)